MFYGKVSLAIKAFRVSVEEQCMNSCYKVSLEVTNRENHRPVHPLSKLVSIKWSLVAEVRQRQR